MTYSIFLLIFIVPLTLASLFYLKKSTHPEKQNFKQALVLLIFLAVAYTTPWDNYLVMTHVWNYEDHNILFRIGYVPFEEYCFFVLQTIMTSCWILFIITRYQLKKASSSIFFKHLITLVIIGLFVASVFMLQTERTRYLGLILVWVTPVFLLQWSLGGQHLLANLKIFTLSLLPPTLYLWVVDNYAIYKGVWAISDAQTLGWKISHLPLEEAVFFISTNIMLCQGLLLYLILKNDFLSYIKRRSA